MRAFPRRLETLAVFMQIACASDFPKNVAKGPPLLDSAIIAERAQEKHGAISLVQPAGESLGFKDDASENIARRILNLDARVKPVTAQMFQILQQVTDDACTAIGKLHRKQDGTWDRNYAEAALKCIDDSLIHHGFLYPDVGGVDQLADALTPFQMSAAQRHSFQAQEHNQRRRKMIGQKFPGPFYVVDCDTASFIYLGVASQLGLPLHLVDVPAYNRHLPHNFVRWREGRHFLDWETMDGCVRTDDYYRAKWEINDAEIKAQSALADLSTDQVMGCEHYLLATQHERRGNYEQALSELALALQLYPQNLSARNQFAWDTAVGSDVKSRNNSEAIEDALFVLHLVNDSDARDTLAAAYASAGLFDSAVKEEQTVLKSAKSSEHRMGYMQRLKLYQHHMVYRELKRANDPAGVLPRLQALGDGGTSQPETVFHGSNRAPLPAQQAP